MNAERWQKIKGLFDAAQELEPKKRARFLDSACGDDPELRGEVEKLLESFDDAESFMESPAAAEVASMFEEKKTLISSPATKNESNGKLIAGTILANRYRIIGMLGKGGMGEVFKAEDIKLNQTVALKFLPDKLEKDRAALERFHAEVRTARQVSHPNVCRVFDIGEVENRHFLSMEFIDGDDLSSLLRRIGRLPPDKAVEISRQLCFGLGAIHEAGILHRDLKPANVIIDSKGKARITDFGIAGLEEELKTGEIRVGTPAYMSPEQITGKEVSQKSDIYSLGLVLYEIFTGKRAFQSDSMPELLQKQQTTAPTNPSEVLKDIDPIVEKTILQCLEKNPSERPKNALQVAMMLPGGNPLAAAIAAGETPSPEMVAAAPKKGSLRPVVAVACLAAIVLMIGFMLWSAKYVRMNHFAPFEKPPQVLAEKASAILKKIGYAEPPADTAHGFDENFNYYDYVKEDASPNRWEKLKTGQPLHYYFWYRQSPRNLQPADTRISPLNEPPMDAAGMATVRLDLRGRLVSLIAVPPQTTDANAAPNGKIDWSILFAEAGLNIADYLQTESQWSPLSYADERIAWEGKHVDHAEFPVRVEAAALNGKPIYFETVAAWDKPLRPVEGGAKTPSTVMDAVMTILFFAVFTVGLILAYRNLKNGRADRKGAFKVALAIFILFLVSSFISADHSDFDGAIGILSKAAESALLSAAVVCLFYLALEPYVRIRRPALVISWNRLLAGDFRDPLIGRDILIGGMFGIGHTFLNNLRDLIFVSKGTIYLPAPVLSTDSLGGVRFVAAEIMTTLADGLAMSMFILLFLLLLTVVLRSERLASIGFWLLLCTNFILGFGYNQPWFGKLFIVFIATMITVAYTRFGLVAATAYGFFFWLTFRAPITTDFAAWYADSSLIILAVVLALAIYGFYTSLAGQKIFEANFLKDVET
ncbi:MAG TPA: serine/threonine-protein kinase [Pyrinomonadaceae bacterium]|jgi:serine/threonine-protein kinase